MGVVDIARRARSSRSEAEWPVTRAEGRGEVVGPSMLRYIDYDDPSINRYNRIKILIYTQLILFNLI
jgi:hypothetical protein